MEATTITEVLRQPDHLRNQNLIIMKVLGVCEIDKLYLDNSDGVLPSMQCHISLMSHVHLVHGLNTNRSLQAFWTKRKQLL